jgi:hypothetical protein
MCRPPATLGALSFSPSVNARWADASGVERIPFIAAGTEPLVFLAGRPAAERATDAGARWFVALVLIRLAINNNRLVILDCGHDQYYDFFQCTELEQRAGRGRDFLPPVVSIRNYSRHSFLAPSFSIQPFT